MGDFNKQTKINKQVSNDGSSGTAVVFSSVADAKYYYYTAKEQAVFDTWCDTVQWAVINDGDGNATWLKVTMDFAEVGEKETTSADSWHSALDALEGELADHFATLSNVATHSISIEESSDHIY
jgi:hypothetical protein